MQFNDNFCIFRCWGQRPTIQSKAKLTTADPAGHDPYYLLAYCSHVFSDKTAKGSCRLEKR